MVKLGCAPQVAVSEASFEGPANSTRFSFVPESVRPAPSTARMKTCIMQPWTKCAQDSASTVSLQLIIKCSGGGGAVIRLILTFGNGVS